MERYSVTQLAHGRRYERNKLVPVVLHLIKRHPKSYQCSVDGKVIPRAKDCWDGFLFEEAVIEHQQFPPFIVLEVRSMTLIKQKLLGPARLSDELEWTDADRHALDLANAFAGGIRREKHKASLGRRQILTSFGRNEYA